MKKWCSGMSCRSGRGTNSEYLTRDSGTNSRTFPFCSNTCPSHSLRKTMGLPGSHVVSRSEPYCHCLTRSGTVKANQTFFAGALTLITESVVFTYRSPKPCRECRDHVQHESQRNLTAAPFCTRRVRRHCPMGPRPGFVYQNPL